MNFLAVDWATFWVNTETVFSYVSDVVFVFAAMAVTGRLVFMLRSLFQADEQASSGKSGRTVVEANDR